MPSRILPGLGLTGFWDLGADYKTGMDENLRKLSALVQARALSRTTALPGSPADGDIYIVPDGAGANPNEIAIRDNGAWVYTVPLAGYLVWVTDTAEMVRFDGADWVVFGGSGGGSVAPSGRTFTGTSDTAVLADANQIIVGNNAASIAATIPPNADVAFPIWTTLTWIQAGAGAITITAGSGVTVNPAPGFTLAMVGQYAMASATQIAANVWVATGQLEATP